MSPFEIEAGWSYHGPKNFNQRRLKGYVDLRKIGY
jgi:hypothetical protein